MTTLPPLASSDDLDAFASGDADAILASVSAAVRRYCGWHIAGPVTETLTLDGSGRRWLWLPTMQMTALTSVVNDGVTLDLSTVDWSRAGFVELWRSGWHHFSYRARGVVVTLTHGFDEAPEDLVAAIVQIAQRAISSPSGAIREQALTQQVFYATVAPGVSGGIALLDHEKALLAPYKLTPRF